MIKVLAINGSPRHNGNTAHMLGTVLDVCKNAGFETELYQAGGHMVKGCNYTDEQTAIAEKVTVLQTQIDKEESKFL